MKQHWEEKSICEYVDELWRSTLKLSNGDIKLAGKRIMELAKDYPQIMLALLVWHEEQAN